MDATTRYRNTTFTSDLIPKVTQETVRQPVSRQTTYLFGVFPIAETVKYGDSIKTATSYRTKETPEMLAAKKTIAAKLQGKEIILSNRVTGRPTTTSGATIRLIVNELPDKYIIGYRVVC
jgi:hypothetical protein